MKKGFFCFIYVMIASATIFAQQPVIAKAPPMVMGPLTSDEASSVGGVYDRMLSEATGVRILNQLAVEKGMRDYQFQMRDWTIAEKTIAFGDVLDINWVVRPQMFKRALARNEIEIVVTAALLNIRTKEIVHATPVVLRNVNEAQSRIGPLINEITQIVTGGTGGLARSGQSVYKVGDRGPAGGYIYFDKGSYSDGWRYLEIAPPATETSVARATGRETIPGTVRDVGAGKRNTELILQYTPPGGRELSSIKAAQNCANMELNWFKDWFLPSRDELSRLAGIQKHEFGGPDLGGFSTSYYWASSGSEDRVMFAVPGKGLPDFDQPSYSVRAVRAF